MSENKKLHELRGRIDRIDGDIAALVEARLQTVEEIRRLKMSEKMSIIDSEREKKITAHYLRSLGSSTTTDRIIKFIRALIELNPNYK